MKDKDWERHDNLLKRKINGDDLTQEEKNDLEKLMQRNMNPERNLDQEEQAEARKLAEKLAKHPTSLNDA